ncbi:MAG: hypothetical protein ACTHKM_03635 [Tsuneonella sp.]
MSWLIGIMALVGVAAAAALLLFARWLSRSWTVVDEAELEERSGGTSLWFRLGELVGRGPRRLTYRRDERGRFRRHRR